MKQHKSHVRKVASELFNLTLMRCDAVHHHGPKGEQVVMGLSATGYDGGVAIEFRGVLHDVEVHQQIPESGNKYYSTKSIGITGEFGNFIKRIIDC
jgi:hypothetical protein